MNLLVDSAFLIDHLRGDPGARARWDGIFANGDRPYVNEVIVCEVRAGLRPTDVDKLESMLGPLEFVQPGPDTAMLAGRWRYEAHERGFRLSLGDALIGAAAESLGASVLTRNFRDFQLMPVRIESY